MMKHVEVELGGIVVVLPIEDGHFFLCDDNVRFVSTEASEEFEEFGSYFRVVASGMDIPAFSCGDGGNRVV